MKAKLIMVIPKFARRNGITVRVYALVIVAFASLALSLSTAHKAAAAINQIPVVGQPVADIVNTLKDGLIKPLVKGVTSILPQPVGNVLQAPVDAVMKAVDPVVGKSSTSNKRATVQPTQATPTETTAPSSQPLQSSAPEPTNDSVDSLKDLPPLANTTTPLDKHYAILGDMTQNLPAGRDNSTIVAAGTVLLVMALSFAGLIAMIIHSRIQGGTSDEYVFVRKDLAQASAVIVGLLVIGSVLLYMILVK